MRYQVKTMAFSQISRLLVAAAILQLTGCSLLGGGDGNAAPSSGWQNVQMMEISDLKRLLAAEKTHRELAEREAQRNRAEADWLAEAAQATPELRAKIAELEEQIALLMADNQRLDVLEANRRDLEAENKRLSQTLNISRAVAPAAPSADSQAVEPAAAADAVDAVDEFGEGTYAVHLASYRSKSEAQDGWRRLRGLYPKLLGQLSGHYAIFDIASLGGRYYRLKAGPFEGAAGARELCRALNRVREYCVVSVFDGELLLE